MLSGSYEKYCEQASWCNYSYHKIAYWDSFNKQPLSVTHDELGGAKQTILFLHGFPSASWDWHAQWQNLQTQYRCIALDMLGFGISDKPKKHQYSLLEQADIVQYLCQILGIRTAHVVAHDYGVSVAQQLLAQQQQSQLPLSLASICFLNGGLFPEVHRPLFTQRLLHSPVSGIMVRLMSKATLKRSFQKIFGEHSPPSAHEIDMIWRLLKYKQGNLVLPTLLDYLKERDIHRDKWVLAMQQTQTPLGFINGVQDPISGRHMLNRFKQLLPEAPFKALEVGHYPQLEADQLVTESISRFVCTQKFD